MTAPAQRAAITERLTALAGNPGAAAAVLRGLLDNLLEQSKADLEAKRRGSKGQADAIDTVGGLIQVRINWLEDAAKTTQFNRDAPCRAVNQDGASCVRLGPHEAHEFEFATELVTNLATGESHEEPAAAPVSPAAFVAGTEPTCGMVYPGSTDPCLLDPKHVPRKESHQARNSRWPVSPEDVAAYAYTNKAVEANATVEVKEARADVVAYLKGETDTLGTESMFPGLHAPTGVNDNDVPGGPCQPIGCDNGYHLEGCQYECQCSRSERMYCASKKCHGGADLPTPIPPAQEEPVQPSTPDPWANALPVDTGPVRPVWMPKPDPRPFALSADCASPPATVHVTSVADAEQCGLRERLIHRDQVPEQPCMWNVGGTALHMCAEQIERAQLAPGEYQGMSADAAQQWFNKALDRAISDEMAAVTLAGGHQFGDTKTWRVAGKGTEDEAWWRENGPAMVQMYAAWSAQMHAEGWNILQLKDGLAPEWASPVPMAPALELELHWDVLEGRTDQVWCRWEPASGPPHAITGGRWEIRIVDPKSGAKLPDSNWQLGAYANMLAERLSLAGWGSPRADYDLSACFYDARNGKPGDIIDPLAEYGSDEVLYRSQMVMNMHNTNTYPANPGDGYNKPCRACYVRYACPIMALRDAKADA